MIKIVGLTSSRADFGILLPLFTLLESSSWCELEILAFGSHMSKEHGNTLSEIESEGLQYEAPIDWRGFDDSPKGISETMGYVLMEFSKVYENKNIDLILCLGDRYEIFAAISASIPFNIPVAHISGGETTLGAMDNTFRNALTLMSKYHFASTAIYADCIARILGNSNGVYNSGALNFDNLNGINYLTIETFRKRFGVDMSKPTILITVHPETVDISKNKINVHELLLSFDRLNNYQLLITLPNLDTHGSVIRKELLSYSADKDNIFTFDSLGMRGYLSAMKHSVLMIGNTSSGFVEASFFPKWVINLGNRQEGRIKTNNIVDCEYEAEKIYQNAIRLLALPSPEKENVYGNGSSANNIALELKKILA